MCGRSVVRSLVRPLSHRGPPLIPFALEMQERRRRQREAEQSQATHMKLYHQRTEKLGEGRGGEGRCRYTRMWATMASLSCASAVHLFPFSFSPFLSPELRSNQQVMLRKERGVQGENYGKRTANAGRRIVRYVYAFGTECT